MDILELVQQADAAGELEAARTEVQLTAEQNADLQLKLDPLGADLSDEERAAMLARNGLAPEAPVEAVPVVPSPAAPVAPESPAPVPAPVSAAPVRHQPSPEMLAMVEAIKAIKEDLVASRQPAEKRFEDMSEVEQLEYNLIKKAGKANEGKLAALQGTLDKLLKANEDRDRETEANQRAYQFEQAATIQARDVILSAAQIDPTLLTPELQTTAAELVMQRAAAWREDPAKAAQSTNKLIQDIVKAIDQTRILRAQPKVERHAALPKPVPAAPPAVGMTRRTPSNDEVNKYYDGDRFKASRDQYRKIPPAQATG